MIHSFWVIMGGIAMDPSGSDPFIPLSQRATLTANGILFLLEHEPQLLPDISEEEVKDKSKGSPLTKSVACIQASWFCLSCIARISQILPLSLLELNTFAHALCTVIVYVLWWRKPLDIEQPLLVHEDRMRPLLAYMWMASTITFGQYPEFEAIIDDRASGRAAATLSEVSNAPLTSSASNRPPVHNPSTGSPSTTTPPTVTVTTTQGLPGTSFRVNGKSARWKVEVRISTGGEFAKEYKSVYYKPAVINQTPVDVRRWKLAREAIDKYNLKKPTTDLDLVTIGSIPELMTITDPAEKEELVLWAYLGFSLVAACYGGLHALAWNAKFPTHLELKLWRASALIIASPAVLYVVLIILGALFEYRYYKLTSNPNLKPVPKEKSPLNAPATNPQSSPENPPRSKICLKILRVIASDLGYFAFSLGLGTLVILYLPARGYLVYESFRTVFFLPPEAYRATRWTQYFPHIT
jgi:hypothetical protein